MQLVHPFELPVLETVLQLFRTLDLLKTELFIALDLVISLSGGPWKLVTKPSLTQVPAMPSELHHGTSVMARLHQAVASAIEG